MREERGEEERKKAKGVKTGGGRDDTRKVRGGERERMGEKVRGTRREKVKFND